MKGLFLTMTMDYYRLGLSETPHDFFQLRMPWIAEPGSVRVHENPAGGYDISIRIDGTYSDHKTAQRIAAQFQREVDGIVEAVRRRVHDGTTDTISALALAARCPVCKAEAGTACRTRLPRGYHIQRADRGVAADRRRRYGRR
jgi:hypothetical protein